MSLKIIKAGILDTFQDAGRTGYRHLGVNPTGAMDPYAAMLANILVGNAMHDGVLELHFPASVIEFETSTIISLTGANFLPAFNDVLIPVNQPLCVKANSVLSFQRPASGARMYLAIHGGYAIEPWLGSVSTHLKASAGGWQGRKLIKGDRIPYFTKLDINSLVDNVPFLPIPGFDKVLEKATSTENNFLFPKNAANEESTTDPSVIRVLPGNEFSWLDLRSRHLFQTESYIVMMRSDRMGYLLKGTPLKKERQGELVSSPVTNGTIQLWPDGSLMLLMVDHQTTGGYPRIGQVISADITKVAQKIPGDKMKFEFVDLPVAEKLWFTQMDILVRLQKEVHPKLLEFFETKH